MPQVIEGEVPEGLPSSLLLSNSPAAQVLLTEKNRVQYANKAAIHLLGSTKNHIYDDEVVNQQLAHEGTNITKGAEPKIRKQPTTSSKTKVKGHMRLMDRFRSARHIRPGLELPVGPGVPFEPESTVYSLEGLLLRELPIDLDTVTRKWITVEQVVENVKIALRKEADRQMQDLDDAMGYRGKDDEFYNRFYSLEDEQHYQIDEYYESIQQKVNRRDHELVVEGTQEARKRSQEALVKEKQERTMSWGREMQEIHEDSQTGQSRLGEQQHSAKKGLGSAERQNDNQEKLKSSSTGKSTIGQQRASELEVLEMNVKDMYGSNTKIAKQSIPVIIYRGEGQSIHAKVYISLIIPGGGGNAEISSSYTALSILPADVSFASGDMLTRTGEDKVSKADVVKSGMDLTGEARKLVERVTKLKDMVLDEMDYLFMCLTPNDHVFITNKATRQLLGMVGDSSVRFVVFVVSFTSGT